MSTGFSGAESGNVRIGDMVAVFAQAPIGLCATLGARLMGASAICAVETVPARAAMAKKLRADHVLEFRKVDAADEIRPLPGGRGAAVASGAIGPQATVSAAVRVVGPGR